MGSEHGLYHPLPPGHTRLVLVSIEDGGELHFKLLAVSLNRDDPNNWRQRYLALSYTWGDLPKMVGIQVEDDSGRLHHVGVTTSLLEAILAIAENHCDEFCIWIDQLSINQNSSAEKTCQVTMMREIFEAAGSVCVWLGSASKDSKIAARKIRLVIKARQAFENPSIATPRGDYRVEHCRQMIGEMNEACRKQWIAVVNLVEREWFSRVWTIQEGTSQSVMVLGSMYTLMCGNDQLDIHELCLLSTIILSIRSQYEAGYLELSPDWKFLITRTRCFSFLVFSQLWRFRERCSTFRLLDMAEDFRFSQAKDPRDKIYSLLSFATDTKLSDYSLAPDYTVSTEQAYANLIVWHIQTHRDLDFLSGSTIRRTPSSQSRHATKLTLPHWIPDWACRPVATYFRKYEFPHDDVPTPLYFACGSDNLNCLNIQGDVCNSEVPSALTVSGIRLGWHYFGPDWTSSAGRDIISSGKTCPLTKIPLVEVFAKILCLDVHRFSRDSSNFKANVQMRTAKLDAHHSDPGTRSFEINPKNPNVLPKVFDQTVHPSASMILRANHGVHDSAYGCVSGICSNRDEVWALKGGKVLYILSPWRLPRDTRVRNLDVTGIPNSPDGILVPKGTILYTFRAECFIYGLVDGEILDMLGDQPKRPRPGCLADMDKDWRTIHLADPMTTLPEEFDLHDKDAVVDAPTFLKHEFPYLGVWSKKDRKKAENDRKREDYYILRRPDDGTELLVTHKEYEHSDYMMRSLHHVKAVFPHRES